MSIARNRANSVLSSGRLGVAATRPAAITTTDPSTAITALPCAMLGELSQHAWQHKLGGVVACTVASALYLRLVGSRLPTPATRLAVGAVPLCVLNAAIPLVFCRQTEAVTIAFVAFIVTWLGSFKALAWAGGRGRGPPGGCLHALRSAPRLHCLCSCPSALLLAAPHTPCHCHHRAGPLAQHPWSMLQFWALYALPILPAAAAGSSPPPRRPHDAQKQQLQQRQGLRSGPADRTRHLLLRWTLKLGAAAAVVFAMQHEELLSPFAKTCLCSVGIYAMLGEFRAWQGHLLDAQQGRHSAIRSCHRQQATAYPGCLGWLATRLPCLPLCPPALPCVQGW